jgi:hypothetical protein
MKKISEWNDADRNRVASALRQLADMMTGNPIMCSWLRELALAIDN